jgi:hypothetical protein
VAIDDVSGPVNKDQESQDCIGDMLNIILISPSKL